MWLGRSSLALPFPWRVPPLNHSAPQPVVIGAAGNSGTLHQARVPKVVEFRRAAQSDLEQMHGLPLPTTCNNFASVFFKKEVNCEQ